VISVVVICISFGSLFVVRYATIISANQLSINTQTIEESEINKKIKENSLARYLL
jgi:hypothetical protein